MIDDRLHPLHHPAVPDPVRMNNPFSYTPHSLCYEAAAAVQAYLDATPQLMAQERQGKMFGVLVVRTATGERGFVAAYSGLLSGRNNWPWFVPPVFDAQQPDGHFKVNERYISHLNHLIASTEQSEAYRQAQATLATVEHDAEALLCAARKAMQHRKAQRNERRQEAELAGTTLSEAELQEMVRESQYDKAELRRIKKRLSDNTMVARQALSEYEDQLKTLRNDRHRESEALQQWLFTQYEVCNARGETRTLLDLFAEKTGQLPPAGAGDCCAPKLLQYAYKHGLQPLAIAEFWWGPPSNDYLRQPGHYYPACQSKCRAILPFMLQGLDVEPDRSAERTHDMPTVLYADDSIVVIDKPAGMLSVPGKDENRLSAEQFVRQQFNIPAEVTAVVHRLDMDTSGLLVFARTQAAQRALQTQFLKHTVKKRYEALLSWQTAGNGAPNIISLPLRPDIENRPRQMVDKLHGKTAITRFELGEVLPNGFQRVSLWPLTGRTHQLRVHCMHPEGLCSPIAGDPLYIRYASSADTENAICADTEDAICADILPNPGRLCLHAAQLTFVHPVTGKTMTFNSVVPF